jgi:large subunit ribosomal protein L24
MKLKIKKNDTVKVIAGDEKGKTGKVIRVITSENRAVVEGLNLVTKHYKPTAQNTSGRIEKIEAPIHVSNLMLWNEKAKNVAKVGRKLNAEGKNTRFDKRTGEFID